MHGPRATEKATRPMTFEKPGIMARLSQSTAAFPTIPWS